ncbi:MAG: hypothetical protein KKC99_12920 [Proteobacteria bacterium]|nr:hypothetical protein [Pseudomonadota bacterium]
MKRSTFVTLALICTLFIAGCTLGFKSWPEPTDTHDTFSWRSITGSFSGDCLLIEGRLQGAFQNLDVVYLQIEILGDGSCGECPFKPDRTLEFRSGAAGFEHIGLWMKIQVCSVDTTVPHRIRLIGTSKLTGLADVPSDIIRIDP